MKKLLLVILIFLINACSTGGGKGTSSSNMTETLQVPGKTIALTDASFTRGTTEATLSFQSDKDATTFFLASETQIADANTIKSSATGMEAVVANTRKTYTFNGLDGSKQYYLYAVAENNTGTSNIVERLVLSTTDPIEIAVATGDASGLTAVTAARLKAIIDAEARIISDYCKDTLNFLYPNGFEKTEFPSYHSNTFFGIGGKNIPIHQVTTKKGENTTFSIAGEKETGNRYAILGANVFTQNSLVTTIAKSIEQTIKWVMKKNKDYDIFSENIIIVANINGAKASIENWLTTNGKTARWTITTDRSLLDTGAYDLYIGENNSNLAQDYRKVLDMRKPLIAYEDYYWDSANSSSTPEAKEMLKELGISWKWFGSEGVQIWDKYTDSASYCDAAEDMILPNAIDNLEENKLNLNIDDTGCPIRTGKIVCNPSDVKDSITGKSMNEMVMNGINYLRNFIKKFDNAGINIFTQSGNRLLKLAILLGDKYRENINYNLSIWESNQEDFFKAYFGDSSIHTMRPYNPYQNDLGSFTDNAAAQNALTTINKTISFTPTEFKEWMSSMVYLLPGKKATIRRTDSASNTVKLKINFQRLNTTRMWNNGAIATSINNYSRPRFLASHEITLESGKDYEISNPYGGPIYIEISETAIPTPPSITIEFKGIAEHPSINNMYDDASILTFFNNVQNSQLNFVDINTKYTQLHMLKETFVRSINKIDGDDTDTYTPDDMRKFVNEIDDYLIINNLHYAGYLGNGMPTRTASVTQTCTDLGITNECNDVNIHKKPKTQHINIDHFAECGDGCAGNPYDASYGLAPMNALHHHEMGHNLDLMYPNTSSRLRVYHPNTTEVANMIFPYYTFSKYAKDKALEYYGKFPSFETGFLFIQEEIRKGTAAGPDYPLWVGAGYTYGPQRRSFYQQLVFLNESFDIYTKLHIISRILGAKIDTDENWASVKDKIGLSSYTKEEAKNIKAEDFMPIILSKISNKNHTNYFETWGIKVSQKAKEQITLNGTSGDIPLIMYYVEDDNIFADIHTKIIQPANIRQLNGGTSSWKP